MTTKAPGERYLQLKQWLNDNGITQAAVGRQLGISQQRSGDVLKAKDIKAEYWETLCALGVPSELLPRPTVKGVGRPPKQPRWPALRGRAGAHG